MEKKKTKDLESTKKYKVLWNDYRKICKANRKNLQLNEEQVDSKGFYTKLQDKFVLEGLSQQLAA